MTSTERLDLTNAADVAAIVPYLLGFHLHDRLAVLALRGDNLLFAASAALPYSACPEASAASVASRITAHDPDQVLLVGYGDQDTVAASTEHTIDAFNLFGVAVPAALRVHRNRLWHLRCTEPQCRAGGFPFDPSTTAAAAQATFLGLTAAEDISVVTARLDPTTGDERKSMITALAAAHQHLDHLATGTDEQIRTRFTDLCERLVGQARATYRQERHLTDSVAALLLALLRATPLRDETIKHVHGDDLDIRIWTDLTRRADTAHTAAPAVLLALAALQHGNGLLARLAVERAQEADPNASLTQTIADAIDCGIAPDTAHRLLHE
jgi:hypothetical protein